jgi:sugar/nucleoside kinase (ribokinase family)
VSDVDHVHVSGYVLLDPPSRPAGRHALAEARRRGLTTSVDAAAIPVRDGAAFLDWVRGVDLLFANLDEARALLDDHASGPVDLAAGLARYAGQAVVKLGADGAVRSDSAGTTEAVPSLAVTVVDSTGAGDAFTAGVLAAWLTGRDAGAAMRAGTRTAAKALAQTGGRPPHRE